MDYGTREKQGTPMLSGNTVWSSVYRADEKTQFRELTLASLVHDLDRAL